MPPWQALSLKFCNLCLVGEAASYGSVCNRYAPTMLAADPYPDLHRDVATPTHELLEIRHSKISRHRAEADYSYPTDTVP